MKNDKLTTAQLEALRPLERNFRQATDAAWCSYPGKDNIDMMLGIWKELTGQNYPYQPGCGNCLLNLVRDFGHLYFAAKEAEAVRIQEELEKNAADAAAKATDAAKKASALAEGLEPGGLVCQEETKEPQAPKPSPAKKKPAKSKKK